MAQLEFSPAPSQAVPALVVAFDLCGFSTFCNQPDSPAMVPKFISRLFKELNSFLMGSWETFWEGASSGSKVTAPDFIKYTGDGALMIWLDTGGDGFSPAFCTALVAAMRTFQCRYSSMIPEWEKEWRVHGLPRFARIGITHGPVYRLKRNDDDSLDYVGYCINLAIRLQNHCPEVGFLVHEVLHPDLPGLQKLYAVKMKGAQIEPVLAFTDDLKRLPSSVFGKKFAAL